MLGDYGYKTPSFILCESIIKSGPNPSLAKIKYTTYNVLAMGFPTCKLGGWGLAPPPPFFKDNFEWSQPPPPNFGLFLIHYSLKIFNNI